MIPPYVKILFFTTFLIIRVNASNFWYIDNGNKIPINGETTIQLIGNDYQLVIGIE